MKYVLNLGKDGRILSATYEEYAMYDAVIVEELPEGNIADYIYADGQYVFDPLPKPAEPVPVETADNILKALLGV